MHSSFIHHSGHSVQYCNYYLEVRAAGHSLCTHMCTVYYTDNATWRFLLSLSAREKGHGIVKCYDEGKGNSKLNNIADQPNFLAYSKCRKKPAIWGTVEVDCRLRRWVTGRRIRFSPRQACKSMSLRATGKQGNKGSTDLQLYWLRVNFTQKLGKKRSSLHLATSENVLDMWYLSYHCVEHNVTFVAFNSLVGEGPSPWLESYIVQWWAEPPWWKSREWCLPLQ